MRGILKGFKQFILRGSVVDLAVGVVMGAAFNAVVTGLVKDIITPFIGAIFAVPNFADLSFVLHGSKFMYGEFLNALISLLLTAIAIYFFIIVPINALVARMHTEPPADPSTKKCPQCFSEIPKEATRCAFCTQAVA